MSLLKSYLIFVAIYCTSFASYSQLRASHINSQERLNQLISQDSIYEVTLLLNADLAHAQYHHLPSSLAYTNQALGTVFSGIESHETAAKYYTRAFEIYDSLNKFNEVDNVLTHLARSYVDGKNYEKFDSLIPIALDYSKRLYTINLFYNLESEVRKNYFIKDYDDALQNSDKALEQLNNYDFISEHDKAEKKRWEAAFGYYKAVALINLGQSEQGYKVLFDIDSEQFHVKDKEHLFPLSQISTFNFYKFKYYKEYTDQLDLANRYLLKSDSLKFLAVKSLQKKISENGDLIYKIINKEKELQLAHSKRNEGRLLYNAFLIATIVLSLILIGAGIFFYYYYNNRKHIKAINLRLKESNKKLKRIDKERLEFFSILSHELRTPIYGINGLTTLIEQEQSPEKRKGYLNALITSSNYISVLIDNVLQISKLKFENKTLHLKPTNFSQFIKNTTTSIKISANQKGLELYTNIEKTICNEFLLVDKVVLSQILINLTYNAIKYTSKGFVSLNVTEKQRTDSHVKLLFEIKDSGIGIQNKNRDIIFNAFENTTFLEKNSSGSGLGLYIVKTLLKSYNAQIEFTSKPNEGSNFFFEINFEIAELPKSNGQLTPTALDTPSKILIVDDNHINLLVTQKNVEKIPGYFCETATRGKEAICLVKEKDFDMVLMDINMPDMDGYEATKHIRLFNPNIPVLALTALNSVEVQNKAKACGMNYVITKPYEFEVFKSVILKYSHVIQDN
ncbi:MAG: response regulator [Gelidibacter sp.]